MSVFNKQPYCVNYFHKHYVHVKCTHGTGPLPIGMGALYSLGQVLYPLGLVLYKLTLRFYPLGVVFYPVGRVLYPRKSNKIQPMTDLLSVLM